MPDIKVKLDGREYEWVGGMGCTLYSIERGISQGSVRVIQDVIFYAHNVQGKYISWALLNTNMDKIREIKKKLLGLN